MEDCVRLKPDVHSHHGNEQMSRIGGWAPTPSLPRRASGYSEAYRTDRVHPGNAAP